MLRSVRDNVLHWWLTVLWILNQHQTCCAGLTSITLEMGVDGAPRYLSIPIDKSSARDMQDHVESARLWCLGLNVGLSTTRCILSTADYVQSFHSDINDPCHTEAYAQCSRQVQSAPSTFEIPPRASPDLSDLTLGGTAPRERFREVARSHVLSPHSLCQLDAHLRCSVNATLVVDLNCDDTGPQLGVLAKHYKYICVSGSSDRVADNAELCASPDKDCVVANIKSPTLFSDIKRQSDLWGSSDVTVIAARNILETMGYRESLSLLNRIKKSAASFLFTSNTVGSLFFNPVELDPALEYTRLNLHRYPFHLTTAKFKWHGQSLTDVLELFDISNDIPNTYPYYYDDFVCGSGASNMSKLLFGPHCSLVNAPQTQWALYVHRSQARDSSQDGQDGSLQYIFQHIGTTNKYFVEFGFNGPTYFDDTGSNSHFLYRHGWRGLLLDGENSNPDINLHTTWIEPETIVSVFDRHNVPVELDYLSIDIDSTDLWVFRSIISSGSYRPRVVSVEYNSNYPLESTLCNLGEGYRWNQDRISGASLRALWMVGQEFGYSLVDVVPYLDAIFVRSDLLNGSKVPDFSSWRPYTSKQVHAPNLRSLGEIEKYLVDYGEWVSNGHDLKKAKGRAVRHQIEYLDIKL